MKQHRKGEACKWWPEWILAELQSPIHWWIGKGANLVLGAGRCEFNSLVFIDLAELAFCYSCCG
jgi:hypothetical protein